MQQTATPATVLSRCHAERLAIDLCADAAAAGGDRHAADVARGMVTGGLAALTASGSDAEAFVRDLLLRMNSAKIIH